LKFLKIRAAMVGADLFFLIWRFFVDLWRGRWLRGRGGLSLRWRRFLLSNADCSSTKIVLPSVSSAA
jgi:hypothetical protein